jgi:pimeloyl-ACP methyl ester carboxylesterase
VLRHPELSHLPIGLFGASTGAAAALIAAAVMPERIAAVVSRGGRPDMGENALDVVKAPTLLIVGSQDGVVLGLNRKALERLHCVNELHVVPGATHLFEEEGAIEEVARAAADWFVRHMQVAAPAAK